MSCRGGCANARGRQETHQENFTTYTKLGSGLEVARILNGKGCHTKSWTSKKGKFYSGRKFAPKDIYRILNNPLYIGMVQHKGNIYDGEQEAIIDKKLWDKVQYLLKENSKCPSGKSKNSLVSPFKGLLVCGYCGGAFGITYTKKKNRRYMYYICIKDNSKADRECPLQRFAAGAIDKIILQQLSRIFKSPAMLMKTYRELEKLKKEQRAKLLKRFSELKTEQDEVCKQLRDGGDVVILTPRYTELANSLDEVKRELESIGEIYSTDNLAETCGSIEAIWDELFPAERYNLAHILIDRITLFSDHILVDIKHHGLKSLIKDLQSGDDIKVSPSESGEIIRLNIPVVVKRWNGRKLIVTPDEKESELEIEEYEPTAMLKRLGQAHKWTEMLESGEYATVAQLADAVNCDPSKMFKILNLVNLSPAIQKMIVEDNAPESMTLTKLFCEIPENWVEQKQKFLPPSVHPK